MKYKEIHTKGKRDHEKEKKKKQTSKLENKDTQHQKRWKKAEIKIA